MLTLQLPGPGCFGDESGKSKTIHQKKTSTESLLECCWVGKRTKYIRFQKKSAQSRFIVNDFESNLIVWIEKIIIIFNEDHFWMQLMMMMTLKKTAPVESFVGWGTQKLYAGNGYFVTWELLPRAPCECPLPRGLDRWQAPWFLARFLARSGRFTTFAQLLAPRRTYLLRAKAEPCRCAGLQDSIFVDRSRSRCVCWLRFGCAWCGGGVALSETKEARSLPQPLRFQVVCGTAHLHRNGHIIGILQPHYGRRGRGGRFSGWDG